MAVRRPDGQRVPRDANLVWQRALRDYLLSGDAIIIRRATDTGMSPDTWEAIRVGGVLAAQDGQVVYRVNRCPPHCAGARRNRGVVEVTDD
jgi:hypothetical protein